MYEKLNKTKMIVNTNRDQVPDCSIYLQLTKREFINPLYFSSEATKIIYETLYLIFYSFR
jgi:hypothetical protein